MFRKILFSSLFFDSKKTSLLLFLLTFSFFSNAQELDNDCINTGVDKSSFFHDIDNNYFVCNGNEVKLSSKTKNNFNRTDKYTFESIPYNSYPLVGEEIMLLLDDRSIKLVDIPFKFCYFDKSYDKISIHSNGLITFTNGLEPLFSPPAEEISKHSSLPNPNDVKLDGYKNSIMGVYNHKHWGNLPNKPTKGSINYKIYGEYPCRKLVVNFVDLPVNGYECPNTTTLQSSQIVLYEATNIIDINVLKFESCPNKEEGNAIIGILNNEGSIFYGPDNRNVKTFKTEKESWRFTPSGESIAKFEWIIDGKVVGNNEEVNVKIDTYSNVKLITTLDTCEDNSLLFTDELNLKPIFKEVKLDDVIVCDESVTTSDLSSFGQKVLENYETQFKIKYYNSEKDAEEGKSSITDFKNYKIKKGINEIFIKLENDTINCFDIIPLKIIKEVPELPKKENISLCDQYILPTLNNSEVYEKIEKYNYNGTQLINIVKNPEQGQIINEVGFYRVYVKLENKYGCEAKTSFNVFVESCKIPKGISPNFDGENDCLDLTYNNAVELRVYNRYGVEVYKKEKGYKDEWRGQGNNGKLLPSGTYFVEVITINKRYASWVQLTHETK